MSAGVFFSYLSDCDLPRSWRGGPSALGFAYLTPISFLFQLILIARANSVILFVMHSGRGGGIGFQGGGFSGESNGYGGPPNGPPGGPGGFGGGGPPGAYGSGGGGGYGPPSGGFKRDGGGFDDRDAKRPRY